MHKECLQSIRAPWNTTGESLCQSLVLTRTKKASCQAGLPHSTRYLKVRIMGGGIKEEREQPWCPHPAIHLEILAMISDDLKVGLFTIRWEALVVETGLGHICQFLQGALTDSTSCVLMCSLWLPWSPGEALTLYLYYSGQFCLLVGPPVKLIEDRSHVFFIFIFPVPIPVAG